MYVHRSLELRRTQSSCLLTVTAISQEAKLEIPFLRHPSSSTATPYTFKQTLLFSTSLMAASSHYITGLRSQKAGFKVDGGTYKATGWMEIRERAAGGASGQSWTEQLVRQVVGGWWAGERTGGVATRVSFWSLVFVVLGQADLSPPNQFLTTPSSPSSPSSFSLRLHLPSFTKHSVEQVRALISEREGAEAGRLKLDGEGWLELDVEGWKLDEDVKMQVGKAGEM